ncbi:hypothetical protein ACLOJK_004784 [Asimina triloba]
MADPRAATDGVHGNQGSIHRSDQATSDEGSDSSPGNSPGNSRDGPSKSGMMGLNGSTNLAINDHQQGSNASRLQQINRIPSPPEISSVYGKSRMKI